MSGKPRRCERVGRESVNDAQMKHDGRMLLWEIDETAGFDTAWAWVADGQIQAEGRASGLLPTPYWVDYRLDASDAHATRLMAVKARWEGGSASLELRREGGRWAVNGEDRPDLADALDCDLAACPLTNTMPILRHDLHRVPGERDFLMAFIEVPSLRVVPSRQRYTHQRLLDGGGAVVRYASGSFQSDLVIDADGFVVEYPQLGRRVEPGRFPDGIRAAGPGSARPD
jgi:hypothetical protein